DASPGMASEDGEQRPGREPPRAPAAADRRLAGVGGEGVVGRRDRHGPESPPGQPKGRAQRVVRGDAPQCAASGVPAVHRSSSSRLELLPQLYHRVEWPANWARRTARSPQRSPSSDGNHRSAEAAASDSGLYVRLPAITIGTAAWY